MVGFRIYINFFSDSSARELSMHPPHLLDSKGNHIPGALIPFCAYKGNLTTAGRFISGLKYPACDGFDVTVFEGEICYAMNIASILTKGQMNTQPGQGNGLILAIDLGMTIGPLDMDQKVNISEDVTFLGTTLKASKNSFKMHIGLIGTGVYSRPGRYKMSALKKMKATESFLGLSRLERQCQVKIFAFCC